MNIPAIAAAMRAEIEDRKSYMTSSPGDFVRDRLFRESLWEEAAWFWQHYLNRSFGIPELDELNITLRELGSREKMPEWGTRGT